MSRARWFTSTLAMMLLSLLTILPASADVAGLPLQGLDAASAGGPIGNNLLINSLYEDQVYPAMAYNFQREEYLVVWHNQGPSNKGIYGQRVSKNGALVGNWFAISTGSGDRYYPDVAYGSVQDEFLVVWEYNDGTRPNIRGQRVSATGQLLGGEITLGTGGALRSRYTPAVAYAQAVDKYLVVWESFVQGGVASDIEGQVLFGSGALDGSNFLIIQGTWSEDHDQPDLAYNDARVEFLVAWRRQDTSTGGYDVYGQVVKIVGGVGTQGPILLLTLDAKDQQDPAVAAIPEPAGVGQYLVVWDHRYTAIDGDIHAVLVDGNGVFGPGFIISADVQDQSHPAVVSYESAQEYLVVWTHENYVLPYVFDGIVGRQVSLGGAMGAVTAFGGSFADHAAVASGPLGDFLVAFDDQPVLASDRDIYGQLWGNRLYLPLTLRSFQ